MIHHSKNSAMNYLHIQLKETFIEDKSLSAKAKGILLQMLAKPDDWKFYESAIASEFSDGNRSISSGIKELIEKGYIVRRKMRDGSKFAGYEYDVYDHAYSKENDEIPKPHSPFMQNAKTENAKTENEALVTNNCTYELKNLQCTGANKCSSSDDEIFNGISKEVVKFVKSTYPKLYKEHTGSEMVLNPASGRAAMLKIEKSMKELGLDESDLEAAAKEFFLSQDHGDGGIFLFAVTGILKNRVKRADEDVRTEMEE